jgi:hypothetical protein
MPRRDQTGSPGSAQNLPPMKRKSKFRTQKRLRRDGSQANDHIWPDDSDFRLQPWPTRGNLASLRSGVKTAFAPWLPFEMFHRIREINVAAVEAGRGKGLVQQLSGRPDERMPLSVFLVAWDLTDNHQTRFGGAFAEHDLCRVPEQFATLARVGSTPQHRER